MTAQTRTMIVSASMNEPSGREGCEVDNLPLAELGYTLQELLDDETQ
jgi:hypothetical protein